MTTAASNVISQVYGFSQDSYAIQMMYMPLDTPIFHDDYFWVGIGGLLPLVFLAVIKLPDQTIKATSDTVFEPQI